MFDTVLASGGSVRPLREAFRKKVNNWHLSQTTGRTSSLRSLRERIIVRADSALTLAKKTPRFICFIHRASRWSSLCVAMPLS
jgi:hypothetical protein